MQRKSDLKCALGRLYSEPFNYLTTRPLLCVLDIIVFLTMCNDVGVVVCSLLELASASESTASSPSLSSQVLSNLAKLSLVCLKHCTALESYTEDLASGALDVKRHLFDAVVELLIASPAIVTDMLSLLLTILSGKTVLAAHYYLLTGYCSGDKIHIA